ncbi:glycosyltransferase family 4 protein [candidate division WOR-3 bacterium]|nr:glycosyltransferase family 4 protein [candidate division WOR-3 bacterium]
MKGFKRLLLISYFFPPLGLSGVQRAAKFCKYLSYGTWEAEVLTSKPKWYFAFDNELAKEIKEIVKIHRVPSFDHFHCRPFRKYFISEKRDKLAQFGKPRSFALPDAQIGWVPFCSSFGIKLCRQKRFDAVMCSVPPFSSAIAGLIVSKRQGIPLAVDFRDPWIDEKLFPSATKFHRKINLSLEKIIVNNSSVVIVINEKIKKSMSERYPGKDIVVISQGFDPEDFPKKSKKKREGFTLCHMGSLWRGRKPDPLIKAMAELKDLDIRAVFIGKGSQKAVQAAKDAGLSNRVSALGYLNHKAALEKACEANVLWLYISPSEGDAVTTGKLFDYLGTGLPIIASIQKDTDAADVLRKTGAGIVVAPEDHEELALKIRELFVKGTEPEKDASRLWVYERKKLTLDLCAELDRITG